MAIDYDQDIAPLRQQYFPMIAGDKGFDQAMKFRQETIMPMQLHTMKLEQHSMSMRQQDIAYENQKLELSRSRQKTQSQLQFMEKLPDLMVELESLVGDPDIDPYEANKSLLHLQMKYLPSAQHNPLLSNLLTSAGASLNTDRIRREKEEAAALRASERAESRKFGLLTQLAQAGDEEGVATASGYEVDSEESGYGRLASVYNKRNEASAAALAERDRRYKVGETVGQYDDYQKILMGMTTDKATEPWQDIDLGKFTDTTQAAAGVAQFIGKVDVSQVKEIYRDIMARSGRTVDRNLLNQMAKDNPKKLYENTVAKILEHKRLLQPQALYRQDNSISNGFNQ